MARIILIDDDASFCAMLSEVLTRAGHEVSLAGNGFDGVALFRKQNADLILTDIQMPYGGLPTIRVLREECPSLPIIAISGSRAPLALAGALGATQLMAKPFSLNDLLTAVTSAIHKAAASGAA